MDGKTFSKNKRRLAPALTAISLLGTTFVGAPVAADVGPMVVAQGGVAARSATGAFSATAISYDGDVPIFTRVEGATEFAAIAAAKKVPSARKVTLNTQVKVADAGEPTESVVLATDPGRSQQWSLTKINMAGITTSHDLGTQMVAVIDTGVRGTHQDFAPGSVVCPLGVDYVSRAVNGACTDENGHGTHVAGTVAAHTNNGLGIAGVASGVRILPLKVLDANGFGETHYVAEAIRHATLFGATVINLSLGGGYNEAVIDSINYAADRGVTVVAATGNNATQGNTPLWPAAYDGRVIAVGATDENDARASFSTYGPQVDVTAPGTNILSLSHNGDDLYSYKHGTSMATPHVAGVAALLRAKDLNAGVSAVDTHLRVRAVDLGTAGRDDHFGAGRINAGSSHANAPVTAHPQRYRIVYRDGSAASVKRVVGPGDVGVVHTHQFGDSPVATVESTKSQRGYWVVSEKGQVLGFGDALNYGGLGHLNLNAPIIDVAATPTGKGYWLLSKDGGVFSFGDARFFGSTGNIKLNQPAVGMTPTADGNGYWFVASDGGIFAFGSAQFFGSMGNVRLNKPVVGMTTSKTGSGYRMVASDGGIFSFGDARFYGSAAQSAVPAPIVGMLPSPRSEGYWMVTAQGHIYSYGEAQHLGDAVGQPVIAISH